MMTAYGTVEQAVEVGQVQPAVRREGREAADVVAEEDEVALAEGDEVVLLGMQGGDHVTVERMAELVYPGREAV